MSEKTYLQRLQELASDRGINHLINIDTWIKDTANLLSLDIEQTAHLVINLLVLVYPNDIGDELKAPQRYHRDQ